MPKDRTQNNLENNLDGFERVLRALILAGMDPKDAVKVAYHRYPVMRHLYKDLLGDLVGDFAKGYGKKQAAAKFEHEAISAAMKKSWTDDGVTLSERMYKNSKKVQAESAEVIGKAIKEGESAAKTAKKLFDGYGKGGIIPEQDIPEFIQEVKDLPVPDWLDEEAVAEWKAAIRHARKLIEQGTTPGLRAAYSEVMDAIENGAKQNVSKAIDTAVQEKTRYTAERIARTERARAYADGVMAKYLDDPDIVAFQWKLSDRHPKCDICDVYAHADLHGLGKGIFPKDKFPKLPAHPHCLCRIKPIVDGMIDMSKQKDNVDKGGKAYIDTLPKREQERLLGVHGRNDVMSGKKEWFASARSVSKEGFEVRIPSLIQSSEKWQTKVRIPRGSKVDPMFLVDRRIVNTKAWYDLIVGLGFAADVTQLIRRELIACLNINNGVNRERGVMIDTHRKIVGPEAIGEINGDGVNIPFPQGERKPNSLLVLHNHPRNMTFSREDVIQYFRNESVYAGILTDHRGNLFVVKQFNRSVDIKLLEEHIHDVYNKNIINCSQGVALRKTFFQLKAEGLLEYDEYKI